MPWTYSQSTGELRHNGVLVATGYSGAGASFSHGRNNPGMQANPNVGPIPQGRWRIGAMTNSRQTGPNVLPIAPVGHEAFGRTSFQIHGNNRTDNASHGCIIMPPAVRRQIADSGDHDLEVVP